MPDVDAALAALGARTKRRPHVAIVLGSGLGRLAAEVQGADRVPYVDLPGFRRSTAPGHAGELVVGTLAGREVAVMSGRLHYYEGYGMEEVTFPVRVLGVWGVETLILTNACGGLNPAYRKGDLMLHSDHINLMGANPLRGPNDERFGVRFPGMVDAYDETLRAAAKEIDPAVHEGVYVAVAGPNFETAAELRMLRGLGGDAVGMSTVPEVIVARHMGMRVMAVATVTDIATGLPGQIEEVTAESVLAVANEAGARLAALVKGVVARL